MAWILIGLIAYFAIAVLIWASRCKLGWAEEDRLRYGQKEQALAISLLWIGFLPIFAIMLPFAMIDRWLAPSDTLPPPPEKE